MCCVDRLKSQPIPVTELFDVKPFTDIDTARQSIEQYTGSPEDFLLPVSDEIQDPMGITMAIITDAILAKGWDLDGFEQYDTYRVYKYKSVD